MAREQPIRSVHRPPLARLLADLAGADAPAAKQPFAERLGEWLSIKDALALSGALNSNVARAPDAWSPASTEEAAELREALANVRSALLRSISADGWRTPRPLPRGTAGSDEPVDVSVPHFAHYQRHYIACQREMSMSIAGLQATARAALAGHSAALERLATLDAVLEQSLAARRSNLLGKVPPLLAQRFEALHAAHPSEMADEVEAGSDSDEECGSDRELAPGMTRASAHSDWLATFCNEMETVLRAELELRLQPVAGLIAAFDNEVLKSSD